MPFYEHVFVARPDISPQHVEDLARQFAGVVEEGGGKLGKVEYWGVRNLAYPIYNNRKAHYVLMNLDAPPPAVKEMERQISLSDDILRKMTVRVEELEETPSAMLKGKSNNSEGRILQDLGSGGKAKTEEDTGDSR